MLLLVALLSVISALQITFAQDPCTEDNYYVPQKHATNTSIYYICYSTSGSPSTLVCPKGLTFSADARGCAMGGGGGGGGGANDPCPTEGQTVYVEDSQCLKYKKCTKTGIAPNEKLELTPSTCTTGTQYFDPFLGECVAVADFKCVTDPKPDCTKTAYDGLYVTYIGDCQSYYQCKDGIRSKGKCGSGLDLDILTQMCIPQSKSTCSGGGGGGVLSLCKGNAGKFVSDPNYCIGYYYCVDEKTPYWGYCTDKKFFSNGYCTTNRPPNCKCEGIDLVGKGQVYIPGAEKNQYIICDEKNAPIEKTCPSGEIFDEKEEACVAG